MKIAGMSIACSLVIFSSCKTEDEILDEITVNLPTEIQTVTEENPDGLVVVNGAIQGLVANGLTQEVLDGVTVGYASGGTTGSVTADATGGFSITGLAPGDYILTFSKEGFSSSADNVTVPKYAGTTDVVPNGAEWDVVVDASAALYPLSATVNGYAYDGTNSYPAEGAVVILRYNAPVSPISYTVFADEDGYFEFANVPAINGTAAQMTFPGRDYYDFNENVSYDNGTWRPVAVYDNTTTEMGSYELSPTADNSYPVEVVATSSSFGGDLYVNFAPNDPFTITLNQTIDFENSYFYMYILDDDDDPAFEIKATFAETKALYSIEVTPESPLYVYENYVIEGIVTLTDGTIASFSYEFHVYPPFDISNIDVLMMYGGDPGFYAIGLDGITPEEMYDYTENGNGLSNVPVDRSFTLEFSLPIFLLEDGEYDGVVIEEYDAAGNWIRDIEAEVTYNGNFVTITPAEPLDYGTNYELWWDLYADYKTVHSFIKPASFDYLNDYGSIYFTTEYAATEPVTEAPGFRLTDADMVINDNTTVIPVTFTSVNNAVEYYIEANYGYKNTGWKYIGLRMPPEDLLDYQDGDLAGIERSGFIYLNYNRAIFDYFADDATQTPFSHGEEILFRIVAYGADGSSMISDTIVVKDNTPFDGSEFVNPTYRLNEEGNAIAADYSLGTADTTIYFGFELNDSWYANNDKVPTVTVYDGSEATSTVVTAMPATFTWVVDQSWYDNDPGTRKYKARIAVTLPAGTNATGYQLRIAGIEDASGIAMEDTFDMNF